MSLDLNRTLTRSDFRLHPSGLQVPLTASWQGTVSDLLNTPNLTHAGKLDLLLRTPYLLSEDVTARLCLRLMERLRDLSDVTGLFTEPLYMELKAVLASNQLQSYKLHDRLVLLTTQASRQKIGDYGPALVGAFIECATWWDYGSGAYRALNIIRREVTPEGWDEEAGKDLLKIISSRS